MIRTTKSLLYYVSFAVLFTLLFQSFYFLRQIQSLYVLSKVGLPVFGMLLFFLNVVKVPIFVFIACIAYFILSIVSAFMSYSFFGQELIYGLFAQVKMINVFVYPLAIYIFSRFYRSNWGDFEVAVIVTASLTLSIYLVIYLLISPEVVDSYQEFTSHSSSKGTRWSFPQSVIVYGMLFSFTCVVGCFKGRGRSIFLCSIYAIYIILFYYYFISFFQQKMQLFGLLVSMVVYVYWCFHAQLRVMSVLLTVIFGLLMVHAYSDLLINIFLFKVDSLWIRGNSISVILDVFSAGSLWNVFFGFGTLFSLSDNNLQEIYGASFWPADVGWIGLLFEFGVVGVIFFIVFWGWILCQVCMTLLSSKSSLAIAAALYILSLFVLNPLVPKIVFGVGEIMVCLSLIAVFSDRRCV